MPGEGEFTMRKTRIAGAILGAAAVVALAAGPASADNGPTTTGLGSILGGNQVTAPINAPINACGNSGTVGGLAGAAGSNCHAKHH